MRNLNNNIDRIKSQSVPRDGGYCNARVTREVQPELVVSIRPEGRGVLQRRGSSTSTVRCTSQSVPRDGWYCNVMAAFDRAEQHLSQSVPRDGGYCNNRRTPRRPPVATSQSVPRDGGYCNKMVGSTVGGGQGVSIRPEGRGVLQPPPTSSPRGANFGLNPSRGTGGTATSTTVTAKRTGRCLNPSRGTGGTATGDLNHEQTLCLVSIRPEGRGVLQRFQKGNS